MSWLSYILNNPIVSTVSNKWLGTGAIIGVGALVQAGVLSPSMIDLTKGMSNKELAPWIIALGLIYYISHIHFTDLFSKLHNWYVNRKVVKMSNKVLVDTQYLKDLELQKQISELKKQIPIENN